jgi:AcrR family transcriptional regulator
MARATAGEPSAELQGEPDPGAKARPAKGSGSGRRRAALSRDVIIEAALSIGSKEGGSALTFSRLGKELGADPTAVYRHFRDKDELVVALTDRMVSESADQMRAVSPEDVGWREWVRQLAHSIRSVYLKRPAIAILAASRTAASTSETTIVERMIRVLHEAGLPVVEAAEVYRALVDLTLALTQYSAAWSLLDLEYQERDETAWTVTYATLPADRFPLLHQSASRLVELNRDDTAVFELTLGMFLDGVEVRIARHAA